MNILRRIGLSLAAFLFSSALSFFAVFAGVAIVFGTPDTLKSALAGSGLYTVFIQGFMSPNATPAADASDLTLMGIVKPSFVQQTVEGFIDATYDWARGNAKPPSPEDIQASFTNAILAGVQQKISALPPCSGGAMTMPASPEDVSALTCLPPGVTPAALTKNMRSQLSTGDGRTAKTVGSNNQLAEQLAFIPILYQVTQIALIATPIVIIVAALGVIFWSATKRSGVSRVAWILITIGLLQAAATLLGAWALHAAATQSFSDPVTLQSGLLAFFDTVMSQLNGWWIGIGVVYIDLGGVMLLVLYIVNRHRKQIENSQPIKL